MCGIVGFIHKGQKLESGELKRMAHTIRHRGPDDEGYYYHSFGNKQLALAHMRLSILDLSQHGHQPMTFENLTMVYNGEVYNYREIKKELNKYGYVFHSTSDTEVILKSFHQWGMKAVNKFNGMFAIALFDKSKNELFLIRDRIGIKPLHYYFNGENLIFSSELKPIMNSSFFRKEINPYALSLFIHDGYITAPHTIFKNTYKLCPGTILSFRNGTVALNTYWSVKDKYLSRKVDESITEKEAVDQLDDLLKSSIEYRMISDVPIGSFLSGGYDSSLVTATMQELSNTPVNTFSIGFKKSEFNEAPYAKEIARHLRTNHTEYYFTEKDFDGVLRNFINYYDEPFADDSQLPSMIVSHIARKNVKVVLTGDGGDELFCGYSAYDRILKYKKYQYIFIILSQLNRILPLDKLISVYNKNKLQLLQLTDNQRIINCSFFSFKTYFEGVIKNISLENDKRFSEITKISDNIQEANMLRDLINYLPEDILTKVDRATMSASLEARVPLLDHRIIEHSFNIPHYLKFKNNEKKYILKQLTYRKIPKHLLDRPKRGFAAPIDTWITRNLDEFTNELFSKEFILKQDIFKYENIEYLLGNFRAKSKYPFGMYLWHFIVFQMWYRKYID